MVKVRSILIIWCYLLSSRPLMRLSASKVNSQEPERQKNDSHPHASGTADNKNLYAVSHCAGVLCVLVRTQMKYWKYAYSSAKSPSTLSGPSPTRANLQSGP